MSECQKSEQHHFQLSNGRLLALNPSWQPAETLLPPPIPLPSTLSPWRCFEAYLVQQRICNIIQTLLNLLSLHVLGMAKLRVIFFLDFQLKKYMLCWS